MEVDITLRIHVCDNTCCHTHYITYSCVWQHDPFISKRICWEAIRSPSLVTWCVLCYASCMRVTTCRIYIEINMLWSDQKSFSGDIIKDMTRSYLQCDSLICGTWRIHMKTKWTRCGATRSPSQKSWYDMTWLLHMCDVSPHEWHDSFISVTWFICLCDLTHLYVWLDSFVWNRNRRIRVFCVDMVGDISHIWITQKWVLSHMNLSEMGHSTHE
jgi:hypothetical protein